MSKKAEEAALKAYPFSEGKVVTGFGSISFDQHHDAREGFIKGYEQAEKDTIERAAEWLSSIDNGTKIVDVQAFVNAFRNEMEED